MEHEIREFFASETMPADCALRIEAAMVQPRNHRPLPRALSAVAAVLALVLMLGSIPVVRAGAQDIYERFIHTIAPEQADEIGTVAEDHVVLINGFHATSGDATGNDLDVWLYEEENVKFCESRNGRLYFIGNGENLDITDLCSADKAFVYAVADKDGRVGYLAVGGTPESYGQYCYFPIVSDQVTNFEVCDYNSSSTPAWVENAKLQIMELEG